MWYIDKEKGWEQVMSKRRWNLPALDVPPDCERKEADRRGGDHPHLFVLDSPTENVLVETVGRRVSVTKQHYRTPTSFVKLFRDDSKAKDEYRMTVASGQYEDEESKTPIECRWEADANLWGLYIPYLQPSEWRTLDDYRKNQKCPKQDNLEKSRVISSMTQAFWASAIKLISSKLFHCDLTSNLLQNIMVKTSGAHIEELKIVDFGLCHHSPEASVDAACDFYNVVLDDVVSKIYN
tara:strand:- start:277 stop:987 length:711 start_codon:yes stop_codon:yes gene_type:complete